ncbi:hypothetical protein [Burkholderia ubonensis]|uniref:hypothetical protein n=1 Tax=Burkholderia ubonensis TaxID=101571 RepID=UPI0012F72BD2|nr:hypothetical protein [Burkholderia ubonensis]
MLEIAMLAHSSVVGELLVREGESSRQSKWKDIEKLQQEILALLKEGRVPSRFS